LRHLASIGLGLLLACLLQGCAEKRITGPDGIPDVAASLDASERAAFEQAVQYLTVGQSADGGQPVPQGSLDGLTARQVIEHAEHARSTLASKSVADRKAHAAAVIAALLERQRQAVAAREILDYFYVERGRARVVEDARVRVPIVELDVANRTGRTVTEATFRAVYTTPGRETAQVEETFTYAIPDGLATSERVSWPLAPNASSELGKAILTEPIGAVLTVSVVRLVGAGDEVIADGQGLSPFEAQRLDALVREFGMPAQAPAGE